MKLDLYSAPRVFGVKGHEILDLGKVQLAPNEMLSFQTKTNAEYDFVAKEWGFYASPSINSRLKKEGFKTALVMNEINNIYIMVVEENKLELFKIYLKENQNNRVICWLDDWFKEEN